MTAEDFPSVLSEVRLSRDDEDLFYELSERLGVAALDLRDKAASEDPTEIEGAFEAVISTCDACHSRFRVMPAADAEPVE